MTTTDTFYSKNTCKLSLLWIILIQTFIYGQKTAIIKYEYYSSSSNYTNRIEETQADGFVSTKGSQAPVYNGEAFILIDSNDKYYGCEQSININVPYANGIAIVQRGGNCTFSVKITRAKQYGAKGVIIYDPQGSGFDLFNMEQNNSDILSLYVKRSVGSTLLQLATDLRTRLNVTLEPTLNDDEFYRDGTWFTSRGATIFITISICVLVGLCLSWFIFYYCQRYRLRTQKDRLQKRLENAAKKALAKIPLITITENPPIEESCVICLDMIKVGDTLRQLICNHRFHQSCIDPWLVNHRHCPLCNIDILTAYGIPIPSVNTISYRHRSIAPENPVPIHYASLATTAATPIIEQSHAQQSQQIAVINPIQPIPTISESIEKKTGRNNEQNEA